MIYTVTPNPTIDYYMKVDNVVCGKVNRSKFEKIEAGGKGINVSKALTSLKMKNTALGFAGFATSDLLFNLLDVSGVKYDFVVSEAFTTKINTKVLENDGVTEFNSHGNSINKRLLASLLEKLDKLKKGDFIVISGSLPLNDGKDEFYAPLVTYARNKKAFTVADTSGKALLSACECGVDLVKPNTDELVELFGCERNDEALVNSARRLIKLGAGAVLLSDGKNGAMYITKNKVLKADVPMTKASPNTVGAGDSMVAGFIHGMRNSKSDEEWLRNAVAAGSTRVCSVDFFDCRVFEECHLFTQVYELKNVVSNSKNDTKPTAD